MNVELIIINIDYLVIMSVDLVIINFDLVIIKVNLAIISIKNVLFEEFVKYTNPELIFSHFKIIIATFLPLTFFFLLLSLTTRQAAVTTPSLSSSNLDPN